MTFEPYFEMVACWRVSYVKSFLLIHAGYWTGGCCHTMRSHAELHSKINGQDFVGIKMFLCVWKVGMRRKIGCIAMQFLREWEPVPQKAAISDIVFI